jgi:hypothetical protein
MNSYDETRFRHDLDAAMRTIRTILDNTRNPRYPADVPHAYDDKFVLVEFLGRTATAATLQCLGGIGLTAEGLAQLAAWARTQSVTLRLRAQEACTFAREETREVESGQRQVVEKRSMWGTTETTERVVTTVREYFWHFDFTWEVVAFAGPSAEQGVVLQSHTGRVEIKTGAKSPPRPERVIRPHLDANVTLLLGLVDGQQRASFAVDRASPACRTPRRNPQVETALWVFRELASWCARVHAYVTSELFTAQPDHGRDLNALNADGVFVPVAPVFEAARGAQGEGPVPAAWAGAFLAEQRRSLACLRQPDPGLGGGDGGLVAGASGAGSGGFGGEARLVEPRRELAAGPDRHLDLEASDRGRQRIGVVGVAADEVGEGEALLVEQEAEGVGGGVGADPLFGDPDLRQPVTGRLLDPGFGGALAGGGDRCLAGLQTPAIERTGE